MTSIEYLGVPRRVIESGHAALRPSMFAPDELFPVDISIVESGDGGILLLAVSPDGSVRQIGSEQPSVDAARALFSTPEESD